MRIPPPEFHVLGTIGKMDAKRSTPSEPSVKTAVPRPEAYRGTKISRSESESKRDVEEVDGISAVTHTSRTRNTINKKIRSRPSSYFDFHDGRRQRVLMFSKKFFSVSFH